MSLLRGLFRSLGEARRAREQSPEEWRRQGDAALAAEDLGEAARCYEQVLRAQPEDAALLEETARLLFRLDRQEESLAWSDRLVALAPDSIDGWLLRHLALVRLGRHEDALVAIDRALALTGPDPNLLVNRSVPLERLGRLEEAMGSLDAALKIDPTHRAARSNRVPLLIGQRRVREANAAAEALLREYPDDANLHMMLGIGLLLLGDLPRGWSECEWRGRSFAFRDHRKLQLEQPRWRGEDLAGRTIFLHGEQGFGDNIQFLRFVPEVARRAGSVLLLVPEGLESLVAATLPANCRLVEQHSALPQVDYQCALMSIPSVLGTGLKDLPGPIPYLRVPAGAVQDWEQRLVGQGLKVGICWSGNPTQANDHNRSFDFAVFQALAKEACTFVTVQPGLREEDRAALAQWPSTFDAGRDLRDFGDTAALLQALDLVITVDTGVAHLAGALGKPVWILLCYAADWRYMLEREDSPWYPTARLFRQPAPGDWGSVMQRVRAELQALARAS